MIILKSTHSSFLDGHPWHVEWTYTRHSFTLQFQSTDSLDGVPGFSSVITCMR